MTLNGYSANTIEKMKRLCDILTSIQNATFLSKRLSLYGGTALNFIYLDLPRLSEDLDFNYRHIDNSDWGETRGKIDKTIKWILSSLGYQTSKIKINARYNLCRFHIRYKTAMGTNDDIKIEIGYMRRIPDLKNDRIKSFSHLATMEKITVMTPKKEELFANKFATMISRSKTYLNLRDIFDVYSISKKGIDKRLFLELITIETMLMNIPFDMLLETKKRLKQVKTAGSITHLINKEIDFKTMRKQVTQFTCDIIENLSKYNYNSIIDTFYKTRKVDITSFHYKDSFNSQIRKHPQ
ncbi:MAG: nucleotidyl transferase AbiEii/AbiGii toxin family protein, partial [Candidatus Thermoplasmatota archaeon]|nr:nucleotidyl transferase AbiEii/AbiGii toxin family protein [Candidatus Thermoplasmatota archaeon]